MPEIIKKNFASPKIPLKPIVLVGMMGVGKTTFGKKLAKKLEVEFYDSDAEIEQEIGHSVSWIFQNFGEVEFRKIEVRKISELLEMKGCFVLALGGGAFISDEVRKLIKNKATSIWLKASPEVILERVSIKGRRPLIDQAPDKMELIKNMLANREQFYSQADFTVESDKASHKTVLNEMADVIFQSK